MKIEIIDLLKKKYPSHQIESFFDTDSHCEKLYVDGRYVGNYSMIMDVDRIDHEIPQQVIDIIDEELKDEQTT